MYLARRAGNLKKFLIGLLLTMIPVTFSEGYQSKMPTKRIEAREHSRLDIGYSEQPNYPTLSPDGRWVAYFWKSSVWISHAHDTRVSARQLPVGVDPQDNWPALNWSPDGGSILLYGYFGKQR